MRPLALLAALSLGACTWQDAAGVLVNDPTTPVKGAKLIHSAITEPWQAPQPVGKTRYCKTADGSRYFTMSLACRSGDDEITETEYSR